MSKKATPHSGGNIQTVALDKFADLHPAVSQKLSAGHRIGDAVLSLPRAKPGRHLRTGIAAVLRSTLVEPCGVFVKQGVQHLVGNLFVRPLAAEQSQHTGAAGQEATVPLGVADAMTEALKGTHQRRIFLTARLQHEQHQKLAAAEALAHKGQHIHQYGVHIIFSLRAGGPFLILLSVYPPYVRLSKKFSFCTVGSQRRQNSSHEPSAEGD